MGAAKCGLGRQAFVAPVGPATVASYSLDYPRPEVDGPDPLVPDISEVDATFESSAYAARPSNESIPRRSAVIDRDAAQGCCHDTSGAIVPAQPAGTVAPKDGAVRVGPYAGLARVTAGLGAVKPLLAPAWNTVADERSHDARLCVDLANPEAVLLAHVYVVVNVDAQRVGHQDAGLNRGSAVPR